MIKKANYAVRSKNGVYFIFLYSKSGRVNMFRRITRGLMSNDVYSADIIIEDYYDNDEEEKRYGAIKYRNGVIEEVKDNVDNIPEEFYSLLKKLSYSHYKNRNKVFSKWFTKANCLNKI